MRGATRCSPCPPRRLRCRASDVSVRFDVMAQYDVPKAARSSPMKTTSGDYFQAVFSAMAARMSAFNALSSILSPSSAESFLLPKSSLWYGGKRSFRQPRSAGAANKERMDGMLPHLDNHDLSYAVVARAPIEQIEVVRHRIGWQFKWVSSFGPDFNYDFNVSFTPELIASS